MLLFCALLCHNFVHCSFIILFNCYIIVLYAVMLLFCTLLCYSFTDCCFIVLYVHCFVIILDIATLIYYAHIVHILCHHFVHSCVIYFFIFAYFVVLPFLYTVITSCCILSGLSFFYFFIPMQSIWGNLHLEWQTDWRHGCIGRPVLMIYNWCYKDKPRSWLI